MKNPYRYNPAAPHQAVLCLTIEVYEQNPLGQVTGIPIRTKVPQSRIYSFTGKNLDECQEKICVFLTNIEKGINHDNNATKPVNESQTE